MQKSGECDLNECNRYIMLIKEQRNAIVSRVSEICKDFLPDKHTNDVGEMISALNEVDQINHIKVGKISADLQSYDIHENEKYERLEGLKKVLDSAEKK